MTDTANTEVVQETVVEEPVVVQEPIVEESVVVDEPVVSAPEHDVDKDGIEDQTPEELAKYFGDFMNSIGDLFGNLAGGLKDVGETLKNKKDERPEGDESIQDVFKKDV